MMATSNPSAGRKCPTDACFCGCADFNAIRQSSYTKQTKETKNYRAVGQTNGGKRIRGSFSFACPHSSANVSKIQQEETEAAENEIELTADFTDFTDSIPSPF